ncbi:hypothetical protein H0H81_010614 [Sphagnurus paluster]|uniref:SPX domain-containing protein n=1 Tax=Sphagnurus paluster TaxID=117069 RepID=A0A9P7KKL7_9AGAR|nr:hypothetical protein H0H81_010614 [Sphagnurus paluster]
MHFSKTYTQLLLNLPPDLRDNAIQYRQLKKLINQIVRELSSLGLSPAVLQELLERSREEQEALADAQRPTDDGHRDPGLSPAAQTRRSNLPKAVYEVIDDSGRIEPHLRLWVDIPPTSSGSTSTITLDGERTGSSEQLTHTENGGEEQEPLGSEPQVHMSLLWALQRQPWMASAEERQASCAQIPELDSISDQTSTLSLDPEPSHAFDHDGTHPSAGGMNEVVIPLAADMLFFQTLSTAINDLSAHLVTVQSDFVNTLHTLSRTISDSARPTSSTRSNFRTHSGLTSKPWSVSNATKTKSDLYSWREIFQLYIEAEVFESVHELDRGERSLEESETRLKLFAERISARGLGDERKLKNKASREALETFLELNIFILNIKKFQFANAEATRKILKKHTKRTSLPFLRDDPSIAVVLPRANAAAALPRVLVQAIGETLIPIIPHLDDYACLICTSIAFKPIRLNCGHLFCVRCLVKMQKRGNGDCPMCRAPCVLTADRCEYTVFFECSKFGSDGLCPRAANVDWALLNFMQDWFPVEAREKLLQNEKEAAREELEELGIDPDQTCRIM